MASWLKVAEDLFEVVDRRAKLVVGELADEHSGSQPSASNGQEVQGRRTKPKDKGQLRRSSNELRRSSNEPEKPSGNEEKLGVVQVSASEEKLGVVQLSVPTVVPDVISSENLDSTLDNSTTETSAEASHANAMDMVTSTTAEDLQDSIIMNAADNVNEVTITDNNIEAASVYENRNISIENPKEAPETSTLSMHSVVLKDDASSQQIKVASENAPLEVDQGNLDSAQVQGEKVDNAEGNENASLKVDQGNLDSEQVEGEKVGNVEGNDGVLVPQASPIVQKHQDNESESSAKKVQDQLDEAQGLLKSAISTGQSKEARLARVCAGLSSRLQEYKSENSQLEELLVAERERCNSYEAQIKQLQQDLSLSRNEVSKVESSMVDALAAKNAEIEALVSSLDALKRQASTTEGKLASLQANMEAVVRSRELTETRVMQALREELATAERRAEEERAAHNSTKMAAVEREVELEHRAVEASKALARIQRTADESTSRAMELEHKVALLEVECASLNQELQEMETRVRRGQKKTSEEANQILQIQAWQEEVERARQGQREAERKLTSLEAEVQKMRVEMAGMRRDAEHYSRHEHMELEKRYRELTDLLYHKQTQLEAMASERAAAQFQLEKEARRLQEAQVEAERSRASRRGPSSWEDDTDLKALEPLPLHHRHMVGASIQLQRAAKLLDSGAVRATRFLWRYPTARIFLLIYLVFVHLFLMYLLHRLQEQADSMASREVAASMGLTNSSLP